MPWALSSANSILVLKIDYMDRPDDIYHVCVMPCYDKKLEASRSDFEIDGVRDVDCVITTGELEKLILESNIPIIAADPEPLETM